MMKLLRIAIAALLALAPISANAQGVGQLGSGTLWGNSTASRAVAAPTTVTAIIDRAFSASQGMMLSRGVTTWSATYTPVLGQGSVATGTIGFKGITSGTARITPQSIAGTPTLTLPNASGTFAVNATAPLVLDAATGALTLPGAAGQVLSGATPAFTNAPALGVPGSSVGSIAFGNVTSGTVTIQPITGALGSAVLSLPAATDTLIGKATTDTLTNKTYDTAGAGNSLLINGLAATANTGTGAVARAASPVFTTPSLGAALATTINSLTLSTSTGTFTLTNAKTLAATNTITLSGTDSTIWTGASSNMNLAALNLADQTLSGGANVTAANLGTKSSGTLTIDCGTSPLQFVTNGGAFTLTAPANDSSCIVMSTNNGSAGAITFSGFSVGSATGDALTTTNTSKFSISIWRVNGTSGYRVAAMQ